METLNNIHLNTTIKILSICAMIAMVLLAILVYGAHPTDLLTFAFFIIFYIQLPGQFMMRVLGFRPAHISTLLCVGLFTGWAFIIVQYFITDLIQTDALLYGIGPICSIAYIVLLMKNYLDVGGSSFRFTRMSTALFIFLALALLFTLLETQYQYLDPLMDEETFMTADKAFHMGLINTLAHGYPMESPWLSGYYITYHIFTEMMLSVPVRLFGLTSDAAIMCCGPYLTVYAFGTSFYALLREMLVSKQRAGLWCLALMLSNIFIAREPIRSIAFKFVFENDNVAGYAVSCGFAFVIVMKYWYDAFTEGRSSWRYLVIMTALIMLATGIKGPVGVVLVMGLWGTFVLGLILRRISSRSIIPIMIMTAGFLLIYVFVLGSKGQSGVEGSPFGMAKILNITFYKEPLIAWMTAHGIPLMGRYLVLIVVFVIFMLTAFFLPFVIGYIRELILVLAGKKDYYFPRIVVYACFLVGFIGMMVLRFHGRSQIYFGFLPVFFAVLIAIWFFEDMENKYDRSGRIISRTVGALFIAALILCTAGLGLQYKSQIHSARLYADPTHEQDKYLSMSRDEYKAMEWIRENTPDDCIITTDRYFSTDPKKYDMENRWDNRFYLYTVYADRNCYVSGSGYTLPVAEWPLRAERIRENDKLYDKDNPKRDELAKELGINYLVVSKRFTDAGDLSDKAYKLCYSNDDVDVYEIKW